MNSWSRKVASITELLRQIKTPDDALLMLQVVTFSAVVPFLMRLPLDTVSRIITPRPTRKPVPERIDRLPDLIPAIQQAGYPLLRTHCLPRGLALYYFLRRAGLEVELCFGMGVQGGNYGGHCWLRSDNAPYLEGSDPSSLYAEFYRIPTGPTTSSRPDVGSL